MRTYSSYPLILAFLLSGMLMAQDSFTSYLVKPGDTAISIARSELGGNLNMLLKSNDIQNPLSIKPGQTLFIPLGVEAADTKLTEVRGEMKAAKDAKAHLFAKKEYNNANSFLKEAMYLRESGNFYGAIVKCKLASLSAKSAMESTAKEAVVSERVQLLRKSGTVETSSDGSEWQKFRDLSYAEAGNWIRTGSKSSAHLRFPNQSIYELEEDTTIELVELTRNLADEGALRTDILLHDGGYVGKVRKAKKGADHINLNASGLAILIRGTTVRVSKRGNTSGLAMIDGNAQVDVPRQPARQMALGSGITSEKQPDGTFGVNVFQMPPAPVIPNALLKLKGINPFPQLQWNAPKADNVRFELASDKNFVRLLDNRILKEAQAKPADALRPGLYFWRVTSRLNGLDGFSSATGEIKIDPAVQFRLQPNQPMLQKGGGINLVGPFTTFSPVEVDDYSHILGFEYSWDGETYKTMVDDFPVPQTSGEYVLYVRAFTDTGYRSPVETVKLQVEAEAPDVVKHETKTKTHHIVSFEANDPSGIRHLQVAKPDGGFDERPNGFTHKIDRKTGGSITVRAVDNLGNESFLKTYRFKPEL